MLKHFLKVMTNNANFTFSVGDTIDVACIVDSIYNI